MTDAITIQNPRNGGGNTGHVLAKRSVTFTEIRSQAGVPTVSTEEIDVLVKIYPQYAFWLASGEIAPEVGQTSPDYDEANRNLNQPSAG